MEGRGRRIEELSEGQMSRIPSLNRISTKRGQIAKLAREMPGVALTSLSHHIDLSWLLEAYRRTRKDGAVGVDGQTAADYERDLERNLQRLLDLALLRKRRTR